MKETTQYFRRTIAEQVETLLRKVDEARPTTPSEVKGAYQGFRDYLSILMGEKAAEAKGDFDQTVMQYPAKLFEFREEIARILLEKTAAKADLDEKTPGHIKQSSTGISYVDYWQLNKKYGEGTIEQVDEYCRISKSLAKEMDALEAFRTATEAFSKLTPMVGVLSFQDDIRACVFPPPDEEPIGISRALGMHFCLGENTLSYFHRTDLGLEIYYKDRDALKHFQEALQLLKISASETAQTPAPAIKGFAAYQHKIVIPHRDVAKILRLAHFHHGDKESQLNHALELLYDSPEQRRKLIRQELMQDRRRLELTNRFLEKRLVTASQQLFAELQYNNPKLNLLLNALNELDEKLEAPVTPLEIVVPVIEQKEADDSRSDWEIEQEAKAAAKAAREAAEKVRFDKRGELIRHKVEAMLAVIDYMAELSFLPSIASPVKAVLTRMRAVQIPCFGDDTAGISRTIAEHFGQLCKDGEPYVRMEQDGLHFYCKSSMQAELFNILNSYEFRLTKKEGFPEPGFEAYQYQLIIPIHQVSRILELAQYEAIEPTFVDLCGDRIDRFKASGRELAQLPKESESKESKEAKEGKEVKTLDQMKVGVNCSYTELDENIIVRVHIKAPVRPVKSAGHIIFQIDDSGSMGGEKIEAALKAAIRLIGKLPPDTRITIQTLNGGTLKYAGDKPFLKIKQAEITAEMIEAIQGIKATGSTPFVEAYVGSSNYLGREDELLIPPEELEDTALIILSDGQGDHREKGEAVLKAMATGKFKYPDGELKPIIFGGRLAKGLGTPESPGREHLTTTFIGFGLHWDQALGSYLGTITEGGYYHVPSPSDEDVALAVTDAGESYAGEKTKPLIVAVVPVSHPELTEAERVPKLLSGKSTSRTFTLPKSVLQQGFTCTVQNGDAVTRVDFTREQLQKNFGNLVVHVRNLKVAYLAAYDAALVSQNCVMSFGPDSGEAKAPAQAPTGRKAAKAKVEIDLEQKDQPESAASEQELRKDLRAKLFQLRDMLGDRADSEVEALRSELDDILESAQRGNASEMRGMLAQAGRVRAGRGGEAKEVRATAREAASAPLSHGHGKKKGASSYQAPAVHDSKLLVRRDEDNRVHVRRSLNKLIKQHLGVDAILNIDPKTMQFVLDFADDKQASQYSSKEQKEQKPTKTKDAPQPYRITLHDHQAVLEIFNRIGIREYVKPHATTRDESVDLFQRFVGIVMEEIVGTAQSTPGTTDRWPSAVRFSRGRIHIRDGFGNDLNSLEEIETALDKAQKKLPDGVRALIVETIKRYQTAVRRDYAVTLNTYNCLSSPRFRPINGCVQFKLGRREQSSGSLERLERLLFLKNFRQAIAENADLKELVTVRLKDTDAVISIKPGVHNVATLEKVRTGLLSVLLAKGPGGKFIWLPETSTSQAILVEHQLVKIVDQAILHAKEVAKQSERVQRIVQLEEKLPSLFQLIRDPVYIEQVLHDDKPGQWTAPEGHTFNQDAILRCLSHKKKNPLTNSPLDEKQLRRNYSGELLVQQIIENAARFPSILVCPQTGIAYKNPVVAVNGQTYEKDYLKDIEELKGDTTCYPNLLFKNVVEFYQPQLQKPLLIDDPDVSKVLCAAAVMLLPSPRGISKAQAESGILPKLQVNEEKGTLTFDFGRDEKDEAHEGCFDSEDNTLLTYLALREGGKFPAEALERQGNTLQIKGFEHCKRFMIDICGIGVPRLHQHGQLKSLLDKGPKPTFALEARAPARGLEGALQRARLVPVAAPEPAAVPAAEIKDSSVALS